MFQVTREMQDEPRSVCLAPAVSADTGIAPRGVWPRVRRHEPQTEVEESQQPAASHAFGCTRPPSLDAVRGARHLPSCRPRAEAAQLPLLCGSRRSALRAPCQHPPEVPGLSQVPAGVSCPHPVGLMTAASPVGLPGWGELGAALTPLRLSRGAPKQGTTEWGGGQLFSWGAMQWGEQTAQEAGLLSPEGSKPAGGWGPAPRGAFGASLREVWHHLPSWAQGFWGAMGAPQKS